MPASTTVTAVPATAVKRKQRDEEAGSDDEGSDVSMVNVDFDFYNPNPEVDDIALKRLLRQLLSSDAKEFDIHSLAQLVLSQAVQMGIGSTVKVDGTESDPYAYLSLVDLNGCAKEAPIRALLTYLLDRLPKQSPLRDLLASVSSPTSTNRIALVISERLINLPVQLMPPMWKFLQEELENAKKEGNKEMSFTHYLLISRVYKFDGADDDMDMAEAQSNKAPASKKSKKQQTQSAPGIPGGLMHYHPEEEFLERAALYTHTFPFKNAQPRDEESFSVEQRGRLSVYESGKLGEAIAAMEEAVQ
ncbi:hypothetical protein QFC20_002066 [Naganishia adeliensis]|uniref:Uncharacterized protein n=1 Tax=Naganishia adeliensis TaxID=92952 RepID=A0ACC2WNS9_9TREE|nr:hypothetical protein QFC20_002066 [Naganishia adeliensis]